MIIGTKHQLSKMSFNSITIGDEIIRARKSVRNLGVTFDSEMKMNEHVDKITRICYGKLREISSIRKYVTREVAQTLIQSMVISHLDYGNSLLYGISVKLIKQLQRVQNAAARIILGYRK